MARARVYQVEPTGPFEDDPNVTDKKLPGNPTRSYRSRDPLRVVTEVTDWPKHLPEELEGMLTGLARLGAQGLDVVYDSPAPVAGAYAVRGSEQSRGESEGHIHIHVTPSFSYSRIRNSIILRRIAWGGGAS